MVRLLLSHRVSVRDFQLQTSCGLQGIGSPLPFIWTELQEKDMLALESDGLDSVAADLILHRAAGHNETTSLSQQAIELDLYKQTLHQAKV